MVTKHTQRVLVRSSVPPTEASVGSAVLDSGALFVAAATTDTDTRLMMWLLFVIYCLLAGRTTRHFWLFLVATSLSAGVDYYQGGTAYS